MENNNKQQESYVLSYDELYSLLKKAHVSGFMTYEKVLYGEDFLDSNDYTKKVLFDINNNQKDM